MALKSFVDEARKTNALMERLRVQQKGSEEGIIDISEGKSIPKEKLEKIQSQKNNGFKRPVNNNKNYTKFEKNYMDEKRLESENYTIARPRRESSQKIDDRHNNIIANIIRNCGSEGRGNTSWQNCKYKKECNGSVYCKEYMSVCGKEKCNRAVR